MFEKILIANRGEIACRIIRTCRSMGIKTIAVYSEADREMLYVKEADEACYIGDSAPIYSYLNIAKIIEVAKVSGADAIHPGYGFLAENHLFAQACAQAYIDEYRYAENQEQVRTITFIGPKPEVIETMGNKIRALRMAKKSGVPTLKRSRGAIERKDDESTESYDNRVKKIAKNISYPLMVKPQGGGGGIGMRVVYSEKELLSALEACRRQAEGAFDDPAIYLEQYLPDASHIEVQILGDEAGKVVHLFERDCSVQRRNQKIIEESPARKLDRSQRQLICKYAVKLVRRVKKELKIPYTGAGTVEFLVDDDGNIYFIEMNTRLQVEHGVTEMVTGMDLVELQIRIAAGEGMPFKQKDIKRRGHAIEARIYPEIWKEGQFVVQMGSIAFSGFLKNDDGNVRIDSALELGGAYEIPIDYEPLMMKIICKGRNRAEARSRLANVLERGVLLEGVYTNISFLGRIIDSETFRNNKHSTKFLECKEITDRFAVESERIRLEILTRNLWDKVYALS